MKPVNALIAYACLAGVFIAAAPLAAQAQQGGAAEISIRLNRLEEQVRQLTGRNEELQYQVRQMQEQIQRQAGDIDFRMRDLEGGKGGARPPQQPPQRRSEVPAGQPPQRTTGSIGPGPQNGADDPTRPAPGPQDLGSLPSGPTSGQVRGSPGPLASEPGAPLIIAPEFMPPAGAPQGAPSGPAPGVAMQGQTGSMTASGSPDEEYALGAGFLQRKDYEFAETQFSQFLSQFPNDQRAPDALYGLGESYYQRQRYNDAIEPFLKVVAEHGQSGRAPGAMLRLGQTLGAINEREQACATLLELGRKYPRSDSKAQSEREMQRLRC